MGHLSTKIQANYQSHLTLCSNPKEKELTAVWQQIKQRLMAGVKLA